MEGESESPETHMVSSFSSPHAEDEQEQQTEGGDGRYRRRYLRPRYLRGKRSKSSGVTAGTGENTNDGGRASSNSHHGFAGEVYYAPTNGDDCSSRGGGGSGQGSGNGINDEQRRREEGGYNPLCGVDVIVSPGGDDKYR